MATSVEYIDHLFGGPAQREVLFEDEQCIVYEEDEHRQAAVHFRVVPKKVLPRLCAASAEDEKIVGHMLVVAKDMAVKLGLSTRGYHVMVDENFKRTTLDGIHVFGRALHHMLWPVGPGCRL